MNWRDAGSDRDYHSPITPGSSCSTTQQDRGDKTLDVSRQALTTEPLTTLRGASVEVDARRATRVVVALCLTALAGVVVILFVAGAQRNAQITALHEHGVPVVVTVTGCRGLLGGSGSNAAGDSCSGTFVLGGRRYSGTIPGTTLRPPGSRVRELTVESDPGLMATTRQVEDEQASWRVFILPAALLVVLMALVTATCVRRRRDSGTVDSASSTLRAGPRRHRPLLG